MSTPSPREAALKKINDALSAAKEAATQRAERAEARVGELQARLEAAARENERLQAELEQAPAAPAAAAEPRGRFGRRKPDSRVRELQAEVEALRAQLDEPPALLPAHEPEPAAAPAPIAFEGRPTLPQLEALAAQSRSEEWGVYVGLLREHAWPDGTIPPQFDDILRDVFGATF